MANAERDNLIECVDELSIHGWPKLITAPTWKRKLAWLLCCGVAFCYFIYFAMDIVTSHLNLETYTTVKVTQKKSIALPAITFCNKNHMGAFDPVAEAPTFHPLKITCSNYTGSDFMNEKNQQYFEIGCRMFMAKSTAVLSTAKSAKFRFPEQFHFLPHSWPCFTLNRNQVLRQFDADEREGIKMILFFNETEKNAEKIFDPNYLLKDERRGISVDIHDPAEYYHKTQGIFLMPGFHTFVKIQKKTSIKLGNPFPSSTCYKDDLKPDPLTGIYTVERCRFLCFATNTYRKCGLVPNYLRCLFGESMPPKNITVDDIRCFQSAIYAYNTSECNCPPPCKKTVFEKDVSYNRWPQEWQLKYYAPIFSELTGIPRHTVNIEQLRKHLIFLSIYYGEMTETEEREVEAYGSAKVLSDVGGQMGIFLGASFISLYEIVLLIFTTVCKWFKNKLKRVEVRPRQIQVKNNNC